MVLSPIQPIRMVVSLGGMAVPYHARILAGWSTHQGLDRGNAKGPGASAPGPFALLRQLRSASVNRMTPRRFLPSFMSW
jgi:hypothetical protein